MYRTVVDAGTVKAGTVKDGTVKAGTVKAGTVKAGTVRTWEPIMEQEVLKCDIFPPPYRS